MAYAHSSKMTETDWKQAHPLVPDIAFNPEQGLKKIKGRTHGQYVDTGDGHKLYVQEYGNPNGEPMIVLHGGPGGGCDALYARYFDPTRYRIILFDQRGCGHSTPTTHTDLKAAMKGNNTAQLVEDINTIRKQLVIEGKMHLEGGSWGSTLALAYAIKHPQNVKSLTMRGIFLGTEEGMKYIFQGNADHYSECPEELRQRLDTLQEARAANYKAEQALAEAKKSSDQTAIAKATAELEIHPFTDDQRKAWNEAKRAVTAHFNGQPHVEAGGYRAYTSGNFEGKINLPQGKEDEYQHMIDGYAAGWDNFVRQVPTAERGDMIAAYTKRLEATADESLAGTGRYDAATNRIDPRYQQRMAFAFAQWEGLISNYCQPCEKDGFIDLGKFTDPEFAVDFARLEARYTLDGFYLTEDGSPSPGGSNYLLENLHRIAKHHIPMFITHGENDQVCPVVDAHDLKKGYIAALKEAGVENPEDHITVDIRPETGHSMLERGNTLGLIELIKKLPLFNHADKKKQPEGMVGHAERGDGDLPPH